MPSRRKFISQAALGSVAAVTGFAPGCEREEKDSGSQKTIATKVTRPVVVSTWEFGREANAVAMKILEKGGNVLDAVEQGVREIEADPTNSSVGYGGLPDREGHVTLDACIMGPDGKCGSVCAIEDIMHPVTVARMVMERTPHVILVGEGARQFALSQGLQKKNLLTVKSKERWEEWKKESNYKPIINVENHDTIGLLAMDEKGDMAGVCTTSGLAFKMRGRVGDSPVIGAGLYIDNEVGGATATGLGEAVLRTCGSFLVVEMMRQGKSPDEACKIAVERIVNVHDDFENFQVGFIAMNKGGETGGYSIHSGFSYAKATKSEAIDIVPEFYLKK